MIQKIKQLFCPHKDEEVKSFEMDSEFEIIKKAGYRPVSFHSITRKHITDYKCSICGRVKRLVEKTAN